MIGLGRLHKFFRTPPPESPPSEVPKDLPPWFQKHLKTNWLKPYRRVMVAGEKLARSEQPILVGPWVSEVGYELLYWVPFLNWFTQHFGLSPERIHVLTRGGAFAWYEQFAAHGIDIFDFMSVDDFREENQVRWQAGSGVQKQKRVSDFDQRLITQVESRFNSNSHLLHPSLMYNTLKPFWKGWMGSDWVQMFTEFRPLLADRGTDFAKRLELPRDYVVAKFYFSACFPETPENRRACERVLKRLASRWPVVLLDAPWKMDDHATYTEKRHPRILNVAEALSPASNLVEQSELVKGARFFVGTYGGFSYLAPLLGVPSLSVYSDPNQFFHSHLHLASIAARELRAQLPRSSFAAMDVAALEDLVWEGLDQPQPSGSQHAGIH